MLFHIDNNLIFSFSPSNISSSSLSLKSLYSLDFCLIAFLNRLELELAFPGEPAAMLEFCFRVFLGPYARASLSPLNQGTVHRNTKQQPPARSRSLSYPASSFPLTSAGLVKPACAVRDVNSRNEIGSHSDRGSLPSARSGRLRGRRSNNHLTATVTHILTRNFNTVTWYKSIYNLEALSSVSLMGNFT